MDRRRGSPLVLRSVKGEQAPAFGLLPVLQQSEDQFVYEVIARALDRSADANRFLDTLFFALMATQAATYAVIPAKIHVYSRTSWDLLLGAFVTAVAGTALTVFVRDAPDPQTFSDDFPNDPVGTRREYIESYVGKAKANGQLKALKALVLGVSIAMTVASLLIATAWRAGAI